MVNLVTNGDFASATASPDLDPTGWTTTEAANAVQVIGGTLHFNADAANTLNGQISQNITGAPIGQTVTFSFVYSEPGAGQGARHVHFTIRDSNGLVVLDREINTAGTYSYNFTSTTNNYTVTFRDTSTGKPANDAIIDNVVFDVPFVVCFARDTLILTQYGEVPIQNLKIGDLVQTRDHGLQPIRWLAMRGVDASASLAPIRICQGALGNDRDLLVSPHHRMLITDWRAELLFGEPEVLVAARDLVNDTTIRPAPMPWVEYHHFMFDQHQLVQANGAWSESFFPGHFALRAIDSGPRDELFAVFPELRNGNDSYGPAARTSPKPIEARLLRA